MTAAVTSTCCTVPGSLLKYEQIFRQLSLSLPVRLAPFKFVVEVLHRTQFKLVFGHGVQRPSLRGLKVVLNGSIHLLPLDSDGMKDGSVTNLNAEQTATGTRDAARPRRRCHPPRVTVARAPGFLKGQRG